MILKTAKTGELWVDANSHAQPRRMGPGENPWIPREQSRTRDSSREPAGVIRLDSSHPGGARILPFEEEGARDNPRLPAQGEPAELGSSDALDPAVPARRRPEEPAQNAPPLSHHLHPGRCGTSGRNRPAASAPEWTGHAVSVRTSLETIWRFPVRAPGP